MCIRDSTPGVPESFKVLVKELQSLCLDIQVLDEDGSWYQITFSGTTGYVRSDAVSYTHLDVYKRQPDWSCHSVRR